MSPTPQTQEPVSSTDLDALAEQVSQTYGGARLDDIDLEALHMLREEDPQRRSVVVGREATLRHLAVRDHRQHRELPGGGDLGQPVEVLHLPGGELLSVKAPDGREILVPFVAAIVPTVDVAGGFVVPLFTRLP